MGSLFEKIASMASFVVPTPFFLVSSLLMKIAALIGGIFILTDAKNDFLAELNNVYSTKENYLNETLKLISFGVSTVLCYIASALAGVSIGAFSVTQNSQYRAKAVFFTACVLILSFIILNFEI